MSDQYEFGSFVVGPEKDAVTKKEYKPRTKNYQLDEVVSSLQKCIRRGDEELAMYFAVEMIEAGFMDYCWRRLIIIASEDIGIADPFAAILVGRLYENAQIALGKAKKNVLNDQLEPLQEAILYMCRTQKTRVGDNFMNHVLMKRERGWKPDIPDVALDGHTERGRKMGRGGHFFCTESGKISNEVKIEGKNYLRSVCGMCSAQARCPAKEHVASLGE